MPKRKRIRTLREWLRPRPIAAALLFMAAPNVVAAEGRRVSLAVPDALIETGFLKYLLPRFSLKHGIRITLVTTDAPFDAALVEANAPEVTPVFTGAGTTWHMLIAEGAKADPDLARLSDWLGSEIGRKAIAGFAGDISFTPPQAVAAPVETMVMSGDAVRGLELSLTHCGRCHVVGEQNRMNGVGNTPSFAVLRTLNDWEDRFSSFYTLKPHPWFTRVAELSPPFAPGERPTIQPVTLTLGQLDDIMTFAAGIAPADLGAPIKHQ